MQTEQIPVQDTAVSRRFFNNTVLNFAGQGFLLVLTFATAPYTVHHLGAELFGIVALVQTVAGFAGLLNLGIGRALTKYVSELYWTKDVVAINELFQTAWGVCIVSGLLGLVLIIGPRETIGRLFFRGGPEINGVVGFAIYVAAFGLFSSMLLEGACAVPSALQKFGISNAISVFTGTLRYVGAVVALALGYSVRAVLVINLGANLITVAAFAYLSWKLIPGLKLVPIFHLVAFKKLFTFSLPLLISALSALIVTRVDRFILAYYLPLAAVTFYTLPYTLSEKAAMGVGNITAVVFPFTSELHSQGSHDKVHELYLRSTKILTLITLPLTAIMLAVPSQILRFWLGPEYAAQGSLVLSLLGVATLLNAVGAVPTVTALGVGRAWIPAAFSMASSVVNLISNVLLIPRYGINGAAWGALLPQAIVIPAFVYVVTRMLKFPLSQLFFEGLLRPLACAAIQFGVLLAFRRYATNLLSLAVLCLGSLCLYGVLSFFGAISREERAALIRVPTLKLQGSEE